ncbi:MAG: universal stress protein [Deltaproteobacteria bacterium]|nr:universal stress protein [Deltaproteobacteria bacterium]
MEIKSILVPTDFSECSKAALKYAFHLADRFDAEVIVLHVIDQGLMNDLEEVSSISNKEIRENIWMIHERELKKFLGEGIHQVKYLIAEGIPFQEIVKKAKELAVDLIVMGGYGRLGQRDLERIFFGSTAEKVVRLLPCPVLCVPLRG